MPKDYIPVALKRLMFDQTNRCCGIVAAKQNLRKLFSTLLKRHLIQLKRYLVRLERLFILLNHS
jgi:hypothetical protein